MKIPPAMRFPRTTILQPSLQYRATARSYIHIDFSEFILHIEKNLIGCNKARTLDLCPLYVQTVASWNLLFSLH
jgi:hypothetical protein